LTTQLYSH